MAHRITWSPRAVADVESIATYIDADSPSYARSVVQRIFMAVHNLSEFPLSGRMVPEFDDEYIRELLVYSYRIIYRIAEAISSS